MGGSNERYRLMNGKIYGWDDIYPETRDYLKMDKDVASGDYSYRWPFSGSKLSIELISQDDRTLKFFMDIIECKRQSTLIVGIRGDRKSTLQARCSDMPLLRIDYSEQPDSIRHQNPDGRMVVGTHIHLDLDGHRARWAFPLSEQDIIVPGDEESVPALFWAFQDACNITRALTLEQSLGV